MADPVLSPLLAIARDSFPAVYESRDVGSDEGRGSPAMPVLAVSRDRSQLEQFLAAVRDDPQLGQFVVAPGEHGPFLRTNLGSGWRVETLLLAAGLIGSAAWQVIGKARSTEDVQPLLEEVEDVLLRFRRLLKGERDTAVVLDAFEGFELPAGTRIRTPWGWLRKATEIEQGMQLTGSTHPHVMLESTVPLEIQVGEPSGGLRLPSEEWRALGLKGLLVTLSVLLALEESRVDPVGAVWQTVILPAQLGAGFSSNFPPPRRFAPTSATVLTPSEMEGVSFWAELVSRHYEPAIDLAVRRTVSAIRERRDARDALIDAVIAWENLFGHGGSTEVGFRVTAALTLLLEEDSSKRSDFRKELSQVYGVRSAVLHGGEVSEKDDLEARKEKAITVALAALRALLRDRPELISDERRGMRLILGA
jgi:hypothetical protein